MYVVRNQYREQLGCLYPVRLYTDSMSVFCGSTTTSCLAGPRLPYLLAAVLEKYSNGESSQFCLIPGKQNPADGLTKVNHNKVLDDVLTSGRLNHDVTEARICAKAH